MEHKKIKMKELKVGDIFTNELKLRNREAFKVLKIKSEKSLLCVSRTSGKETTKSISGSVYFLRRG